MLPNRLIFLFNNDSDCNDDSNNNDEYPDLLENGDKNK